MELDGYTYAFGETTDAHNGVEIDWSEQKRVTVDDTPTDAQFGTDEFYVLEEKVVTKPIPQPYQTDSGVVWLMKPRDELRKAAWSLDNSYWTLNHPDTDNGMVSSVDQVRGFWRNPKYINGKGLAADLYVPVNDEEAQQFIEENPDVSVGFRHGYSRVDAYDGAVTDADGPVPSKVDALQTNILFNHTASVSKGRCSGEQGCGFAADSFSGEGFIYPTEITEEDRGTVSNDASTHVHEGNWYAVPPKDNPDNEWKYPIENCNDAKDAWNLRGRGDLSISVQTLEERIKRRASDLGCELPSTASEDTINGTNDYYINMTDTTGDGCGCGGDGSNGVSIDDISDLDADFIAANHDTVNKMKEKADSYEDMSESADELTEELGVDTLDGAMDKVSAKLERLSELEERVDAIDKEEAEEHAEFIRENTSEDSRLRQDLDELVEERALDRLEEKRAIAEEMVSQPSQTTANSTDESTTSKEAPTPHNPWE